MCRSMQLLLCCQITMDRMLARGQDASSSVWSLATKTHPGSVSIWQPASKRRNAREGVERLQVPLG